MALLTILTAPDPRLKVVAKSVEHVDETVRRLMDDMVETMLDHDGIGLAAPQIGVSKRVIVIELAREEGADASPGFLKMANPEVLRLSPETSLLNEACLSIPYQQAVIERPAQVTIRYLDENNDSRELEAKGLLATCIQHEIDHLNGILFIDHLSRLKREMILRKVIKARKYTL